MLDAIIIISGIISLILFLVVVIGTLFYRIGDNRISKAATSCVVVLLTLLITGIALATSLTIVKIRTVNTPTVTPEITSTIPLLTPSPTNIIPTVTPLPTVIVVNLPLSSLEVVVDSPASMIVDHSYIIKVSLTPAGQTLIANMVIENATATATNPIPVGTAGVSLKNAFGPGYEPVAFATLSPSQGPFTITPIGADTNGESLEQPAVVWKWSVIPSSGYVGTQIMDVDVEVLWKSTIPTKNSSNGNVYVRRIEDKQFTIDILEPSNTPTPSPIRTTTPTTSPLVILQKPIVIDIGAIVNTILVVLFGGGGIVIYFARKTKGKKKNSTDSTNKKTGAKTPAIPLFATKSEEVKMPITSPIVTQPEEVKMPITSPIVTQPEEVKMPITSPIMTQPEVKKPTTSPLTETRENG